MKSNRGILAFVSLVMLVGMSAAMPAFGADDTVQSYYSIASTTVEELSVGQDLYGQETQDGEFETGAPMSNGTPSGDGFDGQLDKYAVILDKIIVIGEKIWKIVDKGRPVVSVSTKNASALPSGAQNWDSLEGWRMPKVGLYRIYHRNGFGVIIADLTVRITFTPGGSVEGVGQYLANVSVVPHSLYVAWGFSFNCEVQVMNAVNMGTKVKPIAGMELLLKWTLDSPLSHREESQSFFVRGDGLARAL